MGFWQGYPTFPVIYKIAIGFVLGIIAGLLIGPPITVIKPLSDFFIRLDDYYALSILHINSWSCYNRT